MSRQNMDFVTGLYSAGESMDKDQLLAALPELIAQACDPEIEWVEDPQRADGCVYRGHAGVRESWERWLENFDEWGFEIKHIRDHGNRVLVVSEEHGRGSGSEAEVSARDYMVFTFRDGKILRYQEFYDEAQALEAAGLSE